MLGIGGWRWSGRGCRGGIWCWSCGCCRLLRGFLLRGLRPGHDGGGQDGTNQKRNAARRECCSGSRARGGVIGWAGWQMHGNLRPNCIRKWMRSACCLWGNSTGVVGGFGNSVNFPSHPCADARGCAGRGRGCGGCRARWGRGGGAGDGGHGGWRLAWSGESSGRLPWCLE